MARASTLYLMILGVAVAAWIPLYPILFALTSTQRPLVVRFLHDKPRYVYFADSVITTSTPCESDHRTVIEMLPARLGAKTMLFAGVGGNAHLWRDAALFVAARGHCEVASAVIPINMGVFSPRWEHDPDYAFEQDGMLYNLASGRTSASQYLSYLAELHSLAKGRRREQAVAAQGRLLVMAGGTRLGTIEQIGAKAALPEFPCQVDLNRYAAPLRLAFDINYGAPIRADDPYIGDLDETITRLRRGGIRPVVYITPLNFDDIARFAGPEVVAQLKANLALVRRIGTERGWGIVDLSQTLSSAHFITRDCACEHVDSLGRALIARAVAAALVGAPRTQK